MKTIKEWLEKIKEFMTQDYESHMPYWQSLLESWCIGAGFTAWIYILIAKFLKLAFGLEYQAKFVKTR